MAISLEKIYYTALRNFKLKLVAGRAGIWNTISWLHIVEEKEVASFLSGRELVITTGVKKPSDVELLEFVKAMKEADACGVIINVGPYIQTISDELIEYSEQNAFPVFLLPWEVHLVDFNRELCALIYESEVREESLCSIMRKYVYKLGDIEECRRRLGEEGLNPDVPFLMIKCFPEMTEVDENLDYTRFFLNMRMHFSRFLNHMQKTYVIFRHDFYVTTIVFDPDQNRTGEMMEHYAGFNLWGSVKGKLHFALSDSDCKMEDLPNIYEVLTTMCRINVKNNVDIWHWKDLGNWELLFRAKNQEYLRRFMNKTIGALESYDRENDARLCDILDLYLKYDGNMPKVAEEMYIHRNTVSYHLKKVEELLNCDIHNMQDRINLYLALRVREMSMLQ